jgi:hypothetical protein
MSRDLPYIRYWIMYSESHKDGTPFPPSGEASRTRHCGGTSDLAYAQKTVREFRDLASQGKHFLNERQWPNLVLNSAWIEVETRARYEDFAKANAEALLT